MIEELHELRADMERLKRSVHAEWLSISTVAARLDLSADRVRRKAKERGIQMHTIGGEYRISVHDLPRFFDPAYKPRTNFKK